MTPEEIAHLLLTSLLAALTDEFVKHHQQHIRRAATHIHRNLLHWAEPTAQEQNDEMGD